MSDSTPVRRSATTVRVSEIYPSIQGESTHAGRPCVFVRLTGCPLRCTWCDTTYAFVGGEHREIPAVVAEALSFGIGLVEVTGGEPLAQRSALPLLTSLCDAFDEVLLETSGSEPIEEVDPRVRRIIDLKAPGSGEVERNREENLDHLRPGDELKVVLADRADYEWARERIADPRIAPHLSSREGWGLPLHFSPVHGVLDPRELAEWIVEDRLPARLQLQQHKYVWDPEARGV